MGSTQNIGVPEVLVNNVTLKGNSTAVSQCTTTDTIKGNMMYERDSILQFAKMLETGLFASGRNFVETKVFELDSWKEGFDFAAEHSRIGKCVVFVP